LSNYILIAPFLEHSFPSREMENDKEFILLLLDEKQSY